MSDTDKNVEQLRSEVDAAMDQLKIKTLKSELSDLDEQMQKSDFWADSTPAQKISIRHGKLKSQIEPWLELDQEVGELVEFANLKDESLAPEIEQRFKRAQAHFSELKSQLRFSGKYDGYDAIVSIHAGAGGTDAQDWAQMLMRMYLRWAESKRLETKVLDESPGEEAGLKNASFTVSGLHAYGQLRSENGVHRLVRQSPFNVAKSRETSFAMVEVVPQIEEPDEVEIDDADVKIDVFRAGGHGGQSVNTTDSAVRITHEPTGIVVSIQNERSQTQNKDTAFKVLRSKLAHLAEEQHRQKISELKGPSKEAAWGNQIRSYVLHPYNMVKDNRTNHQTSEVQKVLDGDVDEFIDAYLNKTLSSKF